MSTDGGIFISHRRSDANWAGILLESHLASHFGGVRVFFDLKSLKAGEVWPDGIRDNLARCSALIAVIGHTWLTVTDKINRRRIDDEDDWVRKEISTAFERGIPVIPLLLDDAEMPGQADPRDLPKSLRKLPDRQALKLRMADYSQDLDRLAGELAQYLPEEARRPALHEATAETGAKAPGGFLSISDTASLIARASADTDTLRAIMIEEKNKGNSALAEALAHHVSERDKQEPDVDRSRTLISRAIEAQAVLAQGRANEAEKTLRALIPEMERQFGPESPNTLTTRHELARALLAQGKTAEAEAAFRDLLPLMERVRGAEHPGTLTTRHNIATALLNQGKAADAEAAFRDLLPLRERVQGPEHPDTLATRHQLATALLDQGEAAEAEAALRDLLLPIRERVQGPEHPDTLATRRQLVRATLEQGAAEQAREALSALPDGGDQPPATKAREAMLRGWLADLDGDRPAADTLLDQAGALLSHLDPAHHMRRDLARYRETRGPDGKGGTTISAEYTKPS